MSAPHMNPWERRALQYNYGDDSEASSMSTPEEAQGIPATSLMTNPAADPIIYPGLYCPSGFDMMSILLRVISRPNPKINLGPIDCSVALLLCDLAQPDTPIVYASDPFCELTGYSEAEVLGHNCRFLQAPPPSSSSPAAASAGVRRGHSRQHQPRDTIRRMRKAVEKNEELQIELVNFKKNGQAFVNLLSIIPVKWEDGGTYRYSVGLQVEVE